MSFIFLLCTWRVFWMLFGVFVVSSIHGLHGLEALLLLIRAPANVFKYLLGRHFVTISFRASPKK